MLLLLLLQSRVALPSASSALLFWRFAGHAGDPFRPHFHVGVAIVEHLLEYGQTARRQGLAQGHDHVLDKAGLRAA